ncbi:SRPBCC family protein [Rhodococcus ruber]|uniref:SRPBCC family protein n=1 Tax=Rhodococcus ruber TaxID=1830 RepID=UPI0017850F06|nr:SRPBCC family protein [Rhodococcus ruber]MBD8057162.1 SRPBCC family protein [Rhodococcus ruber]
MRTTTVALAVTAASAALTAAAAAVYVGSVTGAMPIDLRVGRRLRPLGPQVVNVAAPREVVYAVLTEPYLGRQTRAVAEKVRILDRGTDMVLADHLTPLPGGLRARTTETVRFTAPDHIDFRLVRGPVPYVVERFQLTETPDGTRLEYHGELGTDLGPLGGRWAAIVAPRWENVVAGTFAAVKTEAERRAKPRGTAGREG